MMDTQRRSTPRSLAAVVSFGVLLVGGAPASAQLIARPVCDRVDCAPAVFEEQVDSILLSEGPLSNDRPAGLLALMEVRVRQELESKPQDARLWMALAELRNGQGDLLPAFAAAARALELGADSALALRAQAESTLRRMGSERRGLELYHRAVAHLSERSEGRFFADLYPLLTPVEVEWWQSSPASERQRWLRGYWEHRAALAGVSVADRLAEHYRRMARAADMFDPPGSGSGAGADADVLWRGGYRRLPYDGRGLVYVRRGPPLDVLRRHVGPFSTVANLSWIYIRVDGTVDLFHFSKGGLAGTSYRVVTPPDCGYLFELPGPVLDATQAAVESGWVLDESPLRGEINRALMSCFGGDARTRRINDRMNALAARQAIGDALRVESPRPPFREGLPALFDFYTFRGEDGMTDVVTAFAVPLPASEPVVLELVTTVADRTGGVIRRVGSQARGLASVEPAVVQADGRAWGFAYLGTEVAPTPEASYRVVIEDTAVAGRGGMWGGEAIVLFYEIYNLDGGEPYRTQVEIREERDGNLGRTLLELFGGGHAIRLGFTAVAPEHLLTVGGGSVVQEVRTLRADLEPGVYRIRVRVTDGRGGVAERVRQVVIEEPDGSRAGT